MRKKDVNEVRFVKYYSKYHNENKIVDISTHPPCRAVLLLLSKKTQSCLEKKLGSKF